MELFIQVNFWISAVGVLLRLVTLSIAEYPVTLKYQRWEHALSVVSYTAWVIWAASLLGWL